MNAMRLLPVASTIIELVCVASSNREFALHLPPRAKEQECFASFIASTITAFIAFSSGVSFFFFHRWGRGSITLHTVKSSLALLLPRHSPFLFWDGCVFLRKDTKNA